MEQQIIRRLKLSMLLAMILPTMLFADDNKSVAVTLLDKAVEAIKADVGVQMDFTYEFSDANGDVHVTDKGFFCVDNCPENKDIQLYTLQMQQMKIWCNGKKQWNYMAQTNEVYLTAANSDEAQSLSPLYLMQLYKSGDYNCSADAKSGNSVVTLTSANEETEFNKIFVTLDTKTLHLERITLVDRDGNSIEIVINAYKSDCKFESHLFEFPANEYSDAELIDMQ